MPRTDVGSKIHRELEECALEKLRSEGYVTDIEVRLGKGRRIDVYGVKGKKTAGVECMVRPYLSAIKKVKEKHSDLNRLIIAIPHFAFSPPTELEVWRLPVRRGMPNVEAILTHVFHVKTTNLDMLKTISGTNRIPLADLVKTAIQEYLTLYTGEVSMTTLKRTIDTLNQRITSMSQDLTHLKWGAEKKNE